MYGIQSKPASKIFRQMPVFSDIVCQFPVSWQVHLLYLNCSGSAYADSTATSGGSTLVIFENFLVFYFAFSKFLIIV